MREEKVIKNKPELVRWLEGNKEGKGMIVWGTQYCRIISWIGRESKTQYWQIMEEKTGYAKIIHSKLAYSVLSPFSRYKQKQWTLVVQKRAFHPGHSSAFVRYRRSVEQIFPLNFLVQLVNGINPTHRRSCSPAGLLCITDTGLITLKTLRGRRAKLLTSCWKSCSSNCSAMTEWEGCCQVLKGKCDNFSPCLSRSKKTILSRVFAHYTWDSFLSTMQLSLHTKHI